MTTYGPGQRLTVTGSGQQVVIWSRAPGSGAYWAHLLPGCEVVLITVRNTRTDVHPLVKVVEYA
jgi:hypothetical protein